MRFTWFNLMPWPYLPDDFREKNRSVWVDIDSVSYTHLSWLLISCLWLVARIEWTRVSIRRKLPVAEWPKQLYL